MSLCFFFFQLCIQPGQVSIIDSALGRTCPAEFNKTTKQRCFTLVTGTSSHWLALKPRHSCTDYSFLSSNPPINSALLQFPPLYIFINPKITFLMHVGIQGALNTTVFLYLIRSENQSLQQQLISVLWDLSFSRTEKDRSSS